MAEPRTVRENANTLSSVQIAEILPHRYPFALVDRVLDYEPGQWAIGRKCVTRNEEFFNGHFPARSRSCPACCCWKHWHRPALWRR